VWPTVRVGLDAVRVKCREAWHPSDVYAAIVSGKAFLYTMYDGFCVLQVNPTFGGPELFVWVMYGPNLLKDHEAEIEAELAKLARTVSARWIRHKSPLRGWERRGWTVKERVYEKEV
jgi:hypothetical protein